jgi:predicted metalloendopeptidase
LHRHGLNDLHGQDVLREIVDVMKMTMDGQSLDVMRACPMTDALMKMDAMKDDRSMAALVDHYYVDALPLLSPIFTS